MFDAYTLDTELTVYSKKDRLDAIEKTFEKLGVAGSTNVSVTVKQSNLLIMDHCTRTISRLNTSNMPVFAKFLFVIKQDESCALLYNNVISPENITGKLKIKCEGLFNLPDIYEASRLVECNAIDFSIEVTLKEMYFDQV